MSWFNKQKKQNNVKPNIKLAKKVLGRDSGRRVFGFPCSPDIQARMKILAGRLNVPMYALMEHALQLSAGLITKMADNEQECEILRRHLIEMHVETRTIEKIAQLDEEMGDVLDRERARWLEIERAVREIVVNFIRRGMVRPEHIAWAIDYGLRCRLAVAKGRPIPTDLPRD